MASNLWGRAAMQLGKITDSRNDIVERNQDLNSKRNMQFFHSFKGYRKHWPLALMFLPIIIYYIVFHYVPMYGITLAFKDFKIGLGIFASPWVGIKHFERLLNLPAFTRAFRNTVIISLMKLVFGFPLPIILALILNEVRHLKFKKVVQTVSYLPHFLSWVVLAGMFMQLLSPSTGLVNYILGYFNIDPIFFLGNNQWFRTTIILTDIWKGIGWSSIIYLAAISGISPSLYEAAICDGANRFMRMLYITLPCILPTITILLILNVGGILSAGFDQIFNLYNSAVYETGDIIDTYVYRIGLESMQYSLSTAVGLFKNLIGFVLVITTNFISKKLTDSGIW